MRGLLRVAILLSVLLAAFSPFSRSVAAPAAQAPAGALLYFTDTKEIRRYDLSTGALVDVLVAPPSEESHDFVDMAFGPDGKLYVIEGFHGQVLRFDAQTGALLDTFISLHAAGLASAYHLVFGPDGYLYIGGADAADPISKVVRYNIATGALIDTFIPEVGGTQTTVQEMVFGSDNNLYITALPISGTRAYVLK
jgi:sugar lactone lactonase YvrE